MNDKGESKHMSFLSTCIDVNYIQLTNVSAFRACFFFKSNEIELYLDKYVVASYTDEPRYFN
jgi:hypothetical protein